jgi:hypothetical protein
MIECPLVAKDFFWNFPSRLWRLTPGLSRTGERYSVTPTEDEPRSPVSAAGLCWALARARGGALGAPLDRPTTASRLPRPSLGTPRPQLPRPWPVGTRGGWLWPRGPRPPWTAPHTPQGLAVPAAAAGAAPHRTTSRCDAPAPRAPAVSARHDTQAPGGGATSGTRSAPAARAAQGRPPGARRRAGATVGQRWPRPTVPQTRPCRRPAVGLPRAWRPASRAGGSPPALAVPRPTSRGASPYDTTPSRGASSPGLGRDIPGLGVPPAPVVPNL